MSRTFPAALLLLALSLVLPTVVTAGDARTARPLAVLVYADWCYNCKLIKPKLAVVQPEYADRIEFERLDVTDDEAKDQSRVQARALGISKQYFANKATGVVLLITPQHEQVDVLKSTLSEDQMRERLDALLAASAS